MKIKLFMLLTLSIWVFAACEEKIDIAKEEVAIKATQTITVNRVK